MTTKEGEFCLDISIIFYLLKPAAKIHFFQSKIADVNFFFTRSKDSVPMRTHVRPCNPFLRAVKKLFQQLSRVVLGVHLADGINDNALFINDVGGAQRAFGHLAVHFFLAPRFVGLEDGEVGVGDEVEG